jgi:hypothetical protein
LRQRIIEETGTDPFDIAREEGIDPDLMLRVIQQESSGNPNAQSKKGAFGYMQLMPATAKELGVDRMDPVQNMRGGARYLRRQLDEFRTVPLALAAYNAGPGNVSKYGAIPPFKETIKYVSRITGIPFTDPSLGQTRSQAAAALGVVRPIARPADLRDPRAAQEDQILQLLQQSMQGSQPQQMQPRAANRSLTRILFRRLCGLSRGPRTLDDAAGRFAVRGSRSGRPAGGEVCFAAKCAAPYRTTYWSIELLRDTVALYSRPWPLGEIYGVAPFCFFC